MRKSEVLTFSVDASGGVLVKVEATLSDSKKQRFSIVGLGDSAVKESKDRVSSILNFMGLNLCSDIVVNLSPADVKKEGTDFDFAITWAILRLVLPQTTCLKDHIFIGEVGLDGTVKESGRTFSAVLGAKLKGFDKFVLPLSIKPKLNSLPFKFQCIFAESILGIFESTKEEVVGGEERSYEKPDVIDEIASLNPKLAKALVLACAGMHSLLFLGPPGQGKTFVARLIPKLLPPLNDQELLECIFVHSLASERVENILERKRPFRDPHHSSSRVSILGGGIKPTPGEVSLAHNGVLFMDELAEFSRSTLEGLRVPLDQQELVISRANYKARMPAKFILVTASNPCPCGYFGSKHVRCRCYQSDIVRYLKKFSGPILDRLDIQLYVDCDDTNKNYDNFNIKALIDKIPVFHEQQNKLYGRCIGFIKGEEAFKMLKNYPSLQKLILAKTVSVRSAIKLFKLALTVCLIKNKELPEEEDVYEAFHFRALDRVLKNSHNGLDFNFTSL